MDGETDRTRVLVVAHDEHLRAGVVRTLSRAGFETLLAVEAEEALRGLRQGRPDLLVLDLDLPDTDGLELLVRVREVGDVPTVVVSRRGGEGDRILGLRAGADDYMVKPLSFAELIARVGAVLRRSKPTRPSKIVHGDLEIHPGSRRIFVSRGEVDLTRREFDLLTVLAAHPRQVFTRDELLREVWDAGPHDVSAATVTEHVRRLRRKVEDRSEHGPWIVAVRGVGYRFDP